MQKFFKFLTVKTVLIFIFLINLSVVLFCFNNKNGFHSDEQWSYAHANSTKGAYLDKEINSYYQTNDNIKQRLFNQWIDSKTLQNYLTVQEKDKFLYKNIYQNLKVVEHPPLYFILLHTVCSFFPDSFSKWYAASINIIAFILIYMMLFKLSKILLKDDKLALVTTTFWGFSSIGIATIVFLRMYILQTLLSLCLAYEIIKIIEANKANSKQLFLVGLYSLLGMYNQYNSIFFSFFATIVSLFFLYKRKNYKLLFQFGGTMLLSVIMLFIIYPQTYEVLSDSLRAKQVVSNMMQQHHSSEFNIMNIFLYLDIRISKFIELITEYFFVFHHTNYQVIAFLFIISVVLSVYFKIKINDSTKWLIWVLILYFIYLLAMPYMHMFHSRYYMSFIPFLAILIIKFMNELLSKIHINNKAIITIIAILVMINSLCLNFEKKSPYAFTYGTNEYQIKEKIANKKVFIDSGEMFIWLHSMVYYLMNAEAVFITEDICNDIAVEKIKETKDPIIFTYSSYIPGNYKLAEINCLNELGLEHKTTVCASQHCYDVWE